MKIHQTTTFQLPTVLHDDLKRMCLYTHVSMGQFIRIAIRDKITQLKEKK